MKALVTGGAGFIGSNVTRLLLDQGHYVTILDDLSSGYSVNVPVRDVRFMAGDIRDAETVARAAEGAEVIFHLAASVGNMRAILDPLADSGINVLGTLNVLEAARKTGARKVVYSSSAAIFGELKTLPIREDHAIEPDSPYGVSKLAGEKHCLAYHKIHGLQITCLRYFNVYGPNQRFDAYGNVVPIFATQLLKGHTLTVFGDGEQTRDFINVGDVARANVLAGKSHACSGAYNLGSGSNVTINTLVDLLHSAANVAPQCVYGPKRPGDVLHSLADIRAIRSALGFEPAIGLTEGLKEYVAWLREDLDRNA